MYFRINHRTDYVYREPASDSFIELRVWPQDGPGQQVLGRGISVQPSVPLDHYVDYFGNRVEYFSVPFRHERLTIDAWTDVETRSWTPPAPCLDVTAGEARQILRSQMMHLFDFVQPTFYVPLDPTVRRLADNPFPPGEPLGPCLEGLNRWIHTHFRYRPGTTEVGTPLAEVIAKRRGVCQDFAHLMLAILRIHGFPARYVSGYIESHTPAASAGPSLTGSAASHAWVEVFLPGGVWWGLDPTNNGPAGERHVRVGSGRDYRDVAPLRGTFKGASAHALEVSVSVQRRGRRKTRRPESVSP